MSTISFVGTPDPSGDAEYPVTWSIDSSKAANDYDSISLVAAGEPDNSQEYVKKTYAWPNGDAKQSGTVQFNFYGMEYGKSYELRYVRTDPEFETLAKVAFGPFFNPALSPDTNLEHFNRLKTEFPFPANCDRIKETKNRAMTLKQLRRIIKFAGQCCKDPSEKRWIDTTPKEYSKTSGQQLDMHFMNLYHMNTWVIMPATARSHEIYSRLKSEKKDAQANETCSMVELMASGDQPPDWFVSHWWGEKVVDFMSAVTKHVAIRMGVEIWENYKGGNQYSMKESYWNGIEWDTAWLGFDLPEEALNMNYWTCAYANRQWALGAEVTPDPEDTSFYKAMRVALSRGGGILLILDAEVKAEGSNDLISGPATPFTRIWCAFEETSGLDLGLALDIATVAEGSNGVFHPQLITGTLTKDEEELNAKVPSSGWVKKVQRESDFPVEVFNAGISCELEKAQASVEIDKIHILNSIIGQENLNATPQSDHPKYQRVDKQLRCSFAIAAWQKAVQYKDPQGFDKVLVGDMQIPATVKADETRRAITMAFPGSDKMNTDRMQELADGMPPNLLHLELIFADCGSLDDDGISVLASGLPQKLKTLILSFQGCIGGDKAISAIADNLPPNLEHLRLNLKMPGTIYTHTFTDDGVLALASKIPASMKKLILDFSGMDKLTDKSLCALADSLPPSLISLELYFADANVTSKEGVAYLAAKLPRSLMNLALDFNGCFYQAPEWLGYKDEKTGELNTCDAGFTALGTNLPASLVNLKVTIKDTILTDAGLKGLVGKLSACTGLRSLTLDLSAGPDKAPHAGDDGLAALGDALPASLRSINLDLAYNLDFSNPGLAALLAKLPRYTTNILFNLEGNKNVRQPLEKGEGSWSVDGEWKRPPNGFVTLEGMGQWQEANGFPRTKFEPAPVGDIHPLAQWEKDAQVLQPLQPLDGAPAAKMVYESDEGLQTNSCCIQC